MQLFSYPPLPFLTPFLFKTPIWLPQFEGHEGFATYTSCTPVDFSTVLLNVLRLNDMFNEKNQPFFLPYNFFAKRHQTSKNGTVKTKGTFADFQTTFKKM